jgi:hypothetical protein
MKPLLPAAAKLFHFYYDGFTSMSSWGKRVWIIIIIKLFIVLIILRVFFFPDFLKRKYDTDEQRSEYILDQLTKSSETHD